MLNWKTIARRRSEEEGMTYCCSPPGPYSLGCGICPKNISVGVGKGGLLYCQVPDLPVLVRRSTSIVYWRRGKRFTGWYLWRGRGLGYGVGRNLSAVKSQPVVVVGNLTTTRRESLLGVSLSLQYIVCCCLYFCHCISVLFIYAISLFVSEGRSFTSDP